MKRRCIVSVAAVTIMLAAIEADAQPPTPHSDTIVRVVTTPQYPGVATLSSVAVVGSNSNAADYLFHLIADVLVASDGSVWVLDSPRPNPRIRLFDSTGRFVRSVGRTGDGPGEYRAPIAMAQLPDGRIAVRDFLARKVIMYTSRGEHSATVPFPIRISGLLFGGDGLRADAAGYVYAYVNVFEGGDPVATPSPLADGGAIVRFTRDIKLIDTLARAALPEPITQNVLTRAGPTPYLNEFAPRGLWQFSPLGYMATASTGRYAIDLRIPRSASQSTSQSSRSASQSTSQSASGAAHSPPAVWRPGDPVVSLRRDVTPVVVSDAERADRHRVATHMMQREHGALASDLPPFPRNKQAFQGFHIDRDGRIWVRISVASERYNPPPAFWPDGTPRMTVPWREPVVYDVLTPEGSWLGSVALTNGRIMFNAVQGNIAWVVTTDANDEERLVRMRIAWQR